MKYVGYGCLLLLSLCSLVACSSRFDTGLGGRVAEAPTEEPTYDDELRTLREERSDLDNRITAARMREDTSGLGNRDPFPEQQNYEDMTVLVKRKKAVESRIRDLEEEDEDASPEGKSGK